jgi:hypothetical protein
MADGTPICPECGKAIYPSDDMTLGQTIVEDASGVRDDEASIPVPFHTDCFESWKEKMEEEPGTA